MYDQLRAIFPLQETSLSQGKDWGHVSGWNKFYANCRGFNYVEVYTDNNSGDHYSCNQGVPSSFTFSGYRETMDDEVFQNDHFEAASDLMVGVLNGSRTAIALALAINLFLESISLQTNLFIAFAALLFQSAISLLFNWYEYHNTHNANNNKFFKLARTILFASLGLIGLTVLMIGSIIALTAFIQLLPTIVFVTGALTALYHAVLAITNVALFLTASNPFDRNDRFLNQAFKRTIQTMGTLAVTIVAALVLSKQMAALAITSPIAISLAIISIGALLYSTCREIPQIRTWHPLRYIFKDVNKRLEELSEESISDKKKRYGKCIAEEKSPLHFETATEKRFYHGGGIIEELNIIRNCHFYQPKKPYE